MALYLKEEKNGILHFVFTLSHRKKFCVTKLEFTQTKNLLFFGPGTYKVKEEKKI